MKRFVCPILVIVAALLLAACQQEGPALQVNDVVSDPGAFSGELNVVGIVYAFARDDATVAGIMDKKELQCTTPNCEKVLLPVKIAGSLPKVGDEVRVSGAFVAAPWGGQVLQAAKVEVLAHHQLGGAR